MEEEDERQENQRASGGSIMKIRPRPFSGECGGEDVEGWILHFEGVCIASGLYEAAQRIALLTVCVEGEAARWARAYGRWLQCGERGHGQANCPCLCEDAARERGANARCTRGQEERKPTATREGRWARGITDDCASMTESDDDEDDEIGYSSAWSDEDEIACTRMADGQKRSRSGCAIRRPKR